MTPEEKVEAINATGALDKAHHDAQAVMNSKAPRVHKYVMLRLIADEVGEVVAPHVPCAKGCNHCCHISVGITYPEARMIQLATGRTMRDLSRTPEETHTALVAAQDAYYGVPCTFLRHGECSIYNDRPMACRTHHSLMDTAANCKPAEKRDEAQTVPTMSFSRAMQLAAGSMFLDQPAGDIRDFFPT